MAETRVYDADQVDRYVAELQGRMASLNAELVRLQQEVAVSEGVARDEAAERALGRALIHAQMAADRATEDAAQKAHQLVENAYRQGREVVAHAQEEAERIVAAARFEARDLLEQARQNGSPAATAARPQRRDPRPAGSIHWPAASDYPSPLGTTRNDRPGADPGVLPPVQRGGLSATEVALLSASPPRGEPVIPAEGDSRTIQ